MSQRGYSGKTTLANECIEYRLQSDCGCIHPCSTQKALGQMVQYGNYKNAKSIIAHSGQPVETMSAGVIYLSGHCFRYK